MTKTNIDIENNCFKLLNVAQVKNLINGAVYLNKRPDGSRAEDVVINSLPITGTQLQVCVVNANVHVPNMQLTINNQPDNSQPNREKLKQIADQVIMIMKDALINDMVTEVQAITMIEEPELNEHYFNIRIEIHSINL